MNEETPEKTLLEHYTEISRNSLIKVQFSCGGSSTSIDEPVAIPIVPPDFKPSPDYHITSAEPDDIEDIFRFLKEYGVAFNDFGNGQKMFWVARTNKELIGCIAIEVNRKAGILRLLAVNPGVRKQGIGRKLSYEAEKWFRENNICKLYLLTTDASDYFTKDGWQATTQANISAEFESLPEVSTTHSAQIIYMQKTL